MDLEARAGSRGPHRRCPPAAPRSRGLAIYRGRQMLDRVGDAGPWRAPILHEADVPAVFAHPPSPACGRLAPGHSPTDTDPVGENARQARIRPGASRSEKASTSAGWPTGKRAFISPAASVTMRWRRGRLSCTQICTTLTDVTADQGAVRRPLVAFNVSRLGDHERQPLCVLIRDAHLAQTTGGLWGRTSWKWLTIELLFVLEQYRGSGLGSEIMRLAEEEAIRRGCIGAWLDTHTPEASTFYEKRGFERFGLIEDFPPSHSRIFLRKHF